VSGFTKGIRTKNTGTSFFKPERQPAMKGRLSDPQPGSGDATTTRNHAHKNATSRGRQATKPLLVRKQKISHTSRNRKKRSLAQRTKRTAKQKEGTRTPRHNQKIFGERICTPTNHSDGGTEAAARNGGRFDNPDVGRNNWLKGGGGQRAWNTKRPKNRSNQTEQFPSRVMADERRP